MSANENNENNEEFVFDTTPDELAILEAVVADNPKMPERDFKKYFLQMFIDGVKDAPDEVTAGWMKLIGSFAIKVDLVDDLGNVIITTPPLIDTSVGRLDSVPDTIVKGYAFAQQQEQNIKQKGDLIRGQVNDVVVDHLEKVVNGKGISKELFELFLHFGVIELVDNGSTSVTTKSKTPVRLDDEDEWS